MPSKSFAVLACLLLVGLAGCRDGGTRDVTDLDEDYVEDARNQAKTTEQNTEEVIERLTGESSVDSDLLEKAIQAGELARKIEKAPEDQHEALMKEAGWTAEEFRELLATIGDSAALREAFEAAREAEPEADAS